MNERSIAKKYFFATLILSFVYAFVRYFIFKEVPASRIPLWITNKATSLASVVLICISVLWRSDKPRKQLGLLGALLGFIHAIMSAALLNPTYY
ncbi:MAG: hypothetical protein NE330_22705 [Lentisphaeraceae bacterium]|nr:hypothetical protein [Lentisphaeraceae bacterium]